jgi:hypothetical protein
MCLHHLGAAPDRLRHSPPALLVIDEAQEWEEVWQQTVRWREQQRQREMSR